MQFSVKRKLFSFILVVVMACMLAGCGANIAVAVDTAIPQKTSDPQNTSLSTAPTGSTTGSASTTQGFSGDQLVVNFLDVGQADSIFIEQGSHAMLVDAGTNEASDTVVNYIKNRGAAELDYVIGTHPHEDHIGGLDAVIKDFKIDKLIMPKASTNTKTYEDVLTAVQQKGLKVTTPVPGKEYAFGDAEFTILAPNSDSYDDLNNYSVVIRLTYGRTSFLLTGDAGDASEAEMLAKGYDLKADVLKVGHHGSSTSSSDAFLDAVDPRYAIISVGLNNDYGHPALETIQKLNDRGIQVYRTDQNGTITVISDGTDIQFSTDKESTGDTASAVTSGNKAAATPSSSESSRDSSAGVVIANVDLAGELVTLRNTSVKDVDISGWTLLSVKGSQSFTFQAGTVIKSGSTLTIASGDATGDIKWTSRNIWNNDGDPAELINIDGKVVSKD